jgi:hypothetical protein
MKNKFLRLPTANPLPGGSATAPVTGDANLVSVCARDSRAPATVTPPKPSAAAAEMTLRKLDKRNTGTLGH